MKPRPRVLIVDPDPDLSMATVRECIALGLEPKLCTGPRSTFACPGLVDEACPRAGGIAAALVAMDDRGSRRALPACAGGAEVIVCSDSLEARGVPSDARLPYPYDPRQAARLLRALVSAAA